MPWNTLGILEPHPSLWKRTFLSAIDQDLVKVTFFNPTGNYNLIRSKIIIRRIWETTNGNLVVEKGIFVYPNPSETIILLPIATDFFEAGLLSYKLEIKKFWNRRWYNRHVISEPVYNVRLQVQ